MREKPQFTHDCDECRFLGRWRGKPYDHPGQTEADFDLYIHTRANSQDPDWIARYGNEGHEYISGTSPRVDVKFRCAPWAMAIWTRLDG